MTRKRRRRLRIKRAKRLRRVAESRRKQWAVLDCFRKAIDRRPSTLLVSFDREVTIDFTYVGMSAPEYRDWSA